VGRYGTRGQARREGGLGANVPTEGQRLARRSWTPDASDVRHQENKQSRTPPKSSFAICALFIILGISALLRSDLPWLGAIVCGLGVFWLFLGWRYGRR
jgi:hypothetical protein